MNTSPKFSTQPLPGDDWETRYTKSIIRNLVRIKEERGLTTQQLADRCNAFLGEKGKIKLSTLNGLFAGKRKSLSVAESHMFAAAVGIPLLALIYPLAEQHIETRPERFSSPFASVLDSAGLGDPSEPLFEDDFNDSLSRDQTDRSSGLQLMFEYWAAFEELSLATLNATRGVASGADSSKLDYLASQLMFPVMNYQRLHIMMSSRGLDAGPAPRGSSWVWEADPKKIDAEFIEAVVAPTFDKEMEEWKSALKAQHEARTQDGSPA